MAQALTHGSYVSVRVFCSVPSSFAGIKTSSNQSLRPSPKTKSIKVLARYDGEHSLYRVSEETLASLNKQCEKRLKGVESFQVKASNSDKKRQIASVLPVEAEEGEHLIRYFQQPLVDKHQSRLLVLNRHWGEFLREQKNFQQEKINELCSFTRSGVTDRLKVLKDSQDLYQTSRQLEKSILQIRSFAELRQFIRTFMQVRQTFVDQITSSLSGQVFLDGEENIDSAHYHQVVSMLVSDLLYSRIKSPYLSALLEHFAQTDLPGQLKKSLAFSPSEILGLESLIQTFTIFSAHINLCIGHALGLSWSDEKEQSPQPHSQVQDSLLRCRYPDEPVLMSAEEPSSVQQDEESQNTQAPVSDIRNVIRVIEEQDSSEKHSSEMTSGSQDSEDESGSRRQMEVRIEEELQQVDEVSEP